MAKESFRETKFRERSLKLIATCEQIVVSYQRQGLRMTLRMLYYQLVTRNVISNTERSYQNLSSLISDARLAGMIDWDAIEDRIRQPDNPLDFSTFASLAEWVNYWYRLPRWEGMADYVELWVEKDALAGVLRPLSRRHHVTLMVNRGYSSQSAMKESAERFRYAAEAGKSCTLLYLGDHDPSGEDMVRDIRARFEMFGVDVSVENLALTMAQIRRYNPPPNPAKVTDPRAAGYIAKFGHSSWEVDALPPNVLTQLINAAIGQHVEDDKLDEILDAEKKNKALIARVLGQLDDDES